MNIIFSDFQENVAKEPLCVLKSFSFDNGKLPNYTNLMHQQLFLLRYFPAYLCEYKYLYYEVVKEAKLSEYNVLSIGCGCFLDYHGLAFASARSPLPIRYTGVDVISWGYNGIFSNSDIQFCQTKIEDFPFPELVDYNIIFFPKSISEISDKGLNTFLGNLRGVNFTSDYIYVISSTMDKGYRHDETKYKLIIEYFKNIGFSCKNYQPAQEIKDKRAFNKFDRHFYYPDDVKDYLGTLNEKCSEYIKNSKSCSNDCKEMSRSPILTTKYVSFLVNFLER